MLNFKDFKNIILQRGVSMHVISLSGFSLAFLILISSIIFTLNFSYIYSLTKTVGILGTIILELRQEQSVMLKKIAEILLTQQVLIDNYDQLVLINN